MIHKQQLIQIIINKIQIQANQMSCYCLMFKIKYIKKKWNVNEEGGKENVRTVKFSKQRELQTF
jgi:hypothetical protein